MQIRVRVSCRKVESVENTADRNALRVRNIQKSTDRRINRLQIVKPRTGEEFPGGSPDRAGDPIVQEEISSEDLFFFNTRCLSDERQEGFSGCFVSEQRRHVFLWMIGIPFIHLPVHMDRQIRDHQEIPVDIDQAALQAMFSPHHDPSGDGKRPVEPGRHEHAAVFFHIQLGVMTVHHDLSVFLDLKGRGIAVRGDDLKMVRILFRNPECDQG